MNNINVKSFGSKSSEDPMNRFSTKEPIKVEWITQENGKERD